MTQDPTPSSPASAPELEEALDEAEERLYTVFDVNPAPALIVRLFDERVELGNSAGSASCSATAAANCGTARCTSSSSLRTRRRGNG